MPRLLIVHHSPTPSAQALADAVIRGARTQEIPDVEVIERAALEATVDDLLHADGYLLGTTANFGYISGALKHFFDTTFVAAQGVTLQRPFSYWIRGQHDTTGAEQALRSITTGYGWTLSARPLAFTGKVTNVRTEQATELGATLSAHLSLSSA